MAPPLYPEVERPSAVDRALGLFATVRAGEGAIAVLLALDVFLVLTAYYTLKVVREPLILTGGAFGLRGAQLKAAAAAAQALLLLCAIPAYAKVASRHTGAGLLNVVSAFFIACLGVFYVLGELGVPIGLAFFIWLGIFNMMAVAQIWAFAADVYTKEQGERLFAVVAMGGTTGAVAGAAVGGWLIARVGPTTVMLIAATILTLAMGLTRLIGARALKGDRSQAPAKDRRGGLGMVLGNRYLLLVALLVLVFNTVNTNGEFILGSTVLDQAVAQFPGDADAQRRLIGSFYGNYFAATNVLTAVLQLFVVGRVMHRFGTAKALVALPIISLIGSSTLVVFPILAVVQLAKILENSTDYSLNNTARQALFLPVQPDAKYKAKAAIDTFFVRFGDLASFGLVAAAGALGMGTRTLAILNIGLICVWATLALRIGRRYREMTI